MAKETVLELCPYCDCEVEIPNEPSLCPVCNNKILPCAECAEQNCAHSRPCPWENVSFPNPKQHK